MELKRTLIRGGSRSLVGRDGFTLIELLIALEIIGILVFIAVPTYLGVQTRAADRSAKANIRTAVPIVEAFAADNIGAKGDADNKPATSGYKGMTANLLRKLYPGLSPTLTVVSGKTTATGYCLTDTQRGRSWSALGPGISAASFKNNAKCK
jgi:prepilin-type N-terminal cleavage/methylation domain-containing protein